MNTRTRKTFLFIPALILIFSGSAFAQIVPRPDPNEGLRRKLEEERQQAEYLKRTDIQNNRRNNDILPGQYSRLKLPPDLAKKAGISKEEKAEFKDFLDAGNKIARLFSAPSCAQGLVINLKDPGCAQAENLDERVYLSYYSFRIQYYDRERWTDLQILEDSILAGNPWHTQGILIDLGETADFNALDKNSAQVKILQSFPIVKTLEEKSEQRTELENGVERDGLRLASKQKVKLNHTYLLRSVAYKVGSDIVRYQYNTDGVYAFKIAKIDTGGSLVILWRKISSKEAPRIY